MAALHFTPLQLVMGLWLALADEVKLKVMCDTWKWKHLIASTAVLRSSSYVDEGNTSDKDKLTPCRPMPDMKRSEK